MLVKSDKFGKKRKLKKEFKKYFKKKYSVPSCLPEKKYIDNFTTSEIISTPSLQCINGIQPGGGFWQRIGRKVCMEGVRLKGEIYQTNNNASAFIITTEFRVAIVYDKQTNGAVPSTFGTVFTDRGIGSTQSITISNINIENRERFEVIYDERIQLPAVGINGVTSTQQILNSNTKTIIDVYFPMKKEVTFNSGTAGTVADITSGSLILIMSADAGTTGTGHPYDFQWTSRVYFRDP